MFALSKTKNSTLQRQKKNLEKAGMIRDFHFSMEAEI